LRKGKKSDRKISVTRLSRGNDTLRGEKGQSRRRSCKFTQRESAKHEKVQKAQTLFLSEKIKRPSGEVGKRGKKSLTCR